jgi:GNAT superfamily N-acetyltransferase
MLDEEINTLSADKNPEFDYCQARCWLAYRNGRIVGRIAGIRNQRHIDKWGQPYLRFGWIDFIDDEEVSRALIETVETWAREEGLTAVHGPLGFTNLDHGGMLVEGFDELATLATIYNFPYYPEHLAKLGYEKDIDWIEYEITVPDQPHEKIAKAADIVLRRNKLKILDTTDKADLGKYTKELFQLLDGEYAQLYATVPLTEKQMDAYIEQYFGVINPDFAPVILDENDKMVAFGIVMPSLSRAMQKAKGRKFPFGFLHLLKALRKNDRADLMLIAVKSEYRGKGVNAVLINHIHKKFNQYGITKVESNPELENNANVQGQWKFYETRQHKRRRCFIKHLDGIEK